MNTKSNAKDVDALLSRAGLRAGGTYREFPGKQSPIVESCQLPEAASQVTVDAERGPVLDDGARANIDHVRPASSLAELLTGMLPRKARSAPAGTKIVVFSLAGGVGRTTLAAAVGRVLSARMRRVVLANCDSSFGFQHLRGPYSQTLGAFTFIHSPEQVSTLPLTLIEAGEPGPALKIVLESSLHSDMILLDLPANRSAQTLELLHATDHILIPLSPDMHSAVTLPCLQELASSQRAPSSRVHYIVNRYDNSRAVHREMRDQFQAMLGSALLPFSIREEPQIQNAMRSGVTIIDYAPRSEAVADLLALSKWVEQLLPCSDLAKGLTA
jgi:cellulose biosynthesis protein BcsQ